MLLFDVPSFCYDVLLLICYVPDGTIVMTHPLDITMTFEEIMCTLGHNSFVIPRRISDARDYRGLFCEREHGHGFGYGRGGFGGPVGNAGPSVCPRCP